MNKVMIDKKQVVGEVRERNKLYRALVKIRQITTESANTPAIEAIAEVCDDALKDVT